MQVISLLEAEAILGEVPSDHKWRQRFIGRFRPRGCATWHDYPPLSLDDSSVLSQDCEQLCEAAAPTIMVGIILEMRGKVPLKDESSEPLCKGALRGYPYSVTYVILIFLFNYFLLCNIATYFLLSYILKGIHFGRVLC